MNAPSIEGAGSVEWFLAVSAVRGPTNPSRFPMNAMEIMRNATRLAGRKYPSRCFIVSAMATMVASAICFSGCMFAVFVTRPVFPGSLFAVNVLCLVIAAVAALLGTRQSQIKDWKNRMILSIVNTTLVFYGLYLLLIGYASFQIAVELRSLLLFGLVFLFASLLFLDLAKCGKKRTEPADCGTPFSKREQASNPRGKKAGRKSPVTATCALNTASAVVVLLPVVSSALGGCSLEIASAIVPGLAGVLAVSLVVLFGRTKESENLLFSSLVALACRHFLRTWA